MQRIKKNNVLTHQSVQLQRKATASLFLLSLVFAFLSACGGTGNNGTPNVCEASIFMAEGDTCDGTLIYAGVGSTGECCPKCCEEGVEDCLPSDYEAFPTEMACKGECPEILCALDCTNGFIKDDNGCNTCECAESCEAGETKDAEDGCNTCTCNESAEWECTELACECEDPCPLDDLAECEFGFQQDEQGCDICECAPDCKPGSSVEKECQTCDCSMEGKWNCVESEECGGCPPPREYEGTCIALEVWAQSPNEKECCQYSDPCSAPEDWEVFPNKEQCLEKECPPMACDLDCENGFATNEKGCPICECAPVCEPGETKDAGDDCNDCVCTGDGQWACTDEVCVEECPEPQENEDPCDSVIVFARNSDSGECCVYPDSCSAPDNWAIYYDLDSCESACVPVDCDIDCAYGFKTDENGCEYCECKDGSCFPPGLETPANDGCNLCVCDSNGSFACTEIGCNGSCPVLEAMPEGCPDGDAWAKDPETDACCLYDACNTPVGWTIFESKTDCEDATCGDTACDIFCENGQKVDENGCELCECNPVCEEGDTKEADDGCNTCSCVDDNWLCTQLPCSTCPDALEYDPSEPWCSEAMSYARNPETNECCEYSSNCAAPLGWPVFGMEQQCLSGCVPVTCLLACEFGFKTDTLGCEICECNPPPGECLPGEEKTEDCNTCFCSMNSTWDCTDLDCEACSPGSTKDADDGCNTCFCNASQEWICGTFPCAVCEPGDTKIADDGCNLCNCDLAGQWDCPTGPCPECLPGETKSNPGTCESNSDYDCSCAGGEWQCPVCPECTPGDIEVTGCNSRTCNADGFWSDLTTNNCNTCGVPWDSKICASAPTWGKEPSTGLCCEYPKPCWVPGSYGEFESLGACQTAD